MNVYDFDKTIYDGDSTFDFYIYSLKKHPKIIFCVHNTLKGAIKHYIFKKISKTQFKEMMYSFLKYVNVEKDVVDFWDSHEHKIKKWYLSQKNNGDVIISASPYFLLCEISKRLSFACLIASDVNPVTGKYNGINCHGEEKVRRFYEKFPNGRIDSFFSDSLSDTPLAKISNKSYLVKGEQIKPWYNNTK